MKAKREKRMLNAMKNRHVSGGWAILYRKGKWFLLKDTTAKDYDSYAIFHWHTKKDRFDVHARMYGDGVVDFKCHCGHKPPKVILTTFLMVT
jgi:hypothetical protein